MEDKEAAAQSTQNENSLFLAIFYPMFNSVRSPFILLFLVCDSSLIFYVGGHQNVTGWGDD